MIVAAVVQAPDELASLLPDWTDLWRRAARPTPFQSPAWLWPWWRQFGTARPAVATIRAAGRLVGVLPAYVLDAPGGPKLLPWGVGVSDYCDALLAPDAPADAADRLVASVLGAFADVAICDLPELPPGAALLAASPPVGWIAHTRAGITCPVLDLSSAAADLAGAVPALARRKLRMNRNRAERIGGYHVEIASGGTLAGDLGHLMRLHGGRWASRGETGVLADGRVRALLQEAAPGLLAEGALRLATLRVGDDVAAATLALAAPPNRLMFYLSGFDGRFAAASPGNILLGHLLAQARQDGFDEIHFLRGDEAYKYAWGAVDRHNASRHFRRVA